MRIGGFGKEDIEQKIEPVYGMEEPWHYRNKAQFPVGYDKEGNLVAGFYAGRTQMCIRDREKQLKALIKEIDSLCMQENILVLSGHTAVSPYVSTLILSVTAMGSITRNKENIVVSKESIADSKGNTKQVAVVNADLDLVVAGTVGREGAAMLAAEYAKRLEERYAPSYVEAAKHLFDDGSMTAVDVYKRQVWTQ